MADMSHIIEFFSACSTSELAQIGNATIACDDQEIIRVVMKKIAKRNPIRQGLERLKHPVVQKKRVNINKLYQGGFDLWIQSIMAFLCEQITKTD